jgi:RHS repeat-associated protein
MVQAMLGAMPQQLQDSANRSMQHALQQGLSPSALAMLGDQGQNTLQRLTGLREQLEKQEQSERTPITVRHYHCDHLGTPLALTDQNQQIVWAARLDPWGNVEQEFNPNSIDQAIRLPGQHQDTDTGLYYNRHRYYDPSIGSYVNQDPIGLAGGNNIYEYALNIPTQIYDPTGLFIPLAVLAGVAGKALLGAAIGAGVEVGMQSGKQVLGQVKDSWDNGRPLAEINWKCIDINWRHVGVSAAVGTVAPGMLSTGKTVYSSGKALRALSGQAANTTARAAKLAARKGAHQKTIKDAVSTQAAWQAASGDEKIGTVDTAFQWIGRDHDIIVEAYDDPGVQGVTCYVSRARVGRHQGHAGPGRRPRRSLHCLPSGRPAQLPGAAQKAGRSVQRAHVHPVQAPAHRAHGGPGAQRAGLSDVFRKADRRIAPEQRDGGAGGPCHADSAEK